MRILLGAMLLLFSTQILATLGTPKDSACPLATTVPATFAAAGGEIVNGLTGKTHTQMINASDVDICFCFHTDTPANCDSDNRYFCLPPNSSLSRDDHQTGDFVRAKYKSGAPTTGFVCAGGW